MSLFNTLSVPGISCIKEYVSVDPRNLLVYVTHEMTYTYTFLLRTFRIGEKLKTIKRGSFLWNVAVFCRQIGKDETKTTTKKSTLSNLLSSNKKNELILRQHWIYVVLSVNPFSILHSVFSSLFVLLLPKP